MRAAIHSVGTMSQSTSFHFIDDLSLWTVGYQKHPAPLIGWNPLGMYLFYACPSTLESFHGSKICEVLQSFIPTTTWKILRFLLLRECYFRKHFSKILENNYFWKIHPVLCCLTGIPASKSKNLVYIFIVLSTFQKIQCIRMLNWYKSRNKNIICIIESCLENWKG